MTRITLPLASNFRTFSVLAALLGSATLTRGQATTNPDAARTAAAAAATPRTGPQRLDWWNDVVFYQIFVRSFKDSASGPLAGDGIGDIPGIIEKLDYLNDGDPKTDSDLGVGGIWLMPIHPSPSYHGYDVLDYRAINPQFGTMDDFRRLRAECEKRGIRLIIDWVPNHTSNQHPWFKDASDPKSPRRDWYIWSTTVPSWRGPWNQAVWHRVGDQPRSTPPNAGDTAGGPFYYGIFSPVMPDLNYRNPQVTAEMEAITEFWLKDVGIDGFRIDAIRHLIEEGAKQESVPETFAWLKSYRDFYKRVKPQSFTVGEVWADTAQAAAYVNDQLDLTFEFDLANAMVQAVRDAKAADLAKVQQRVLALFPPNQYGRFLSNHDQTRVMTQLQNDAGAMRAAAALLLTGPGVPFIYYGEEIGMTGDKPDENLRTPMQWSGGAFAGFTNAAKPWASVNPGFESLNVDKQIGDGDSLLNLYRRLIHLRTRTPSLRNGSMFAVPASDPGLYAFIRRADAADAAPVLVVVNLAAAEVRDWSVKLTRAAGNGGRPARELLSGDAVAPVPALDATIPLDYRPGIPLPARGVLVISLDG